MFFIKYAMKAIEFTKKSITSMLEQLSPLRLIHCCERILPRRHVILAICLSFALVFIASLPSETAIASRNTKAIELPTLNDSSYSVEIPEPIAEQQPELQQPELSPTPMLLTSMSSNRVSKETVTSGDSLSKLFHQAGLNDNDMFKLVNSSIEAKDLAKLLPGQTFTFEITPEGELVSLTHTIDKLHNETFTRTNDSYTYFKTEKTPDIQFAMRGRTIESSLYKAGIDAGLDEQLIMELAGIFGWDIDFALDLRSGDSFKILFEEKFLEGERLGVGRILAAEFVNQNTTFKAVLYTDSQGNSQYYSPTGKAMQKAFLRAPLDFRRISSNFNPRRLHPITKTVKPHRGTDYAASRGTPVWAAGDGKVLTSGYSKANGNYVVIQHGGDIHTKYLHLDKRMVKTGSRVKQKQIIGTVGTTGMSTAPHLHYEFLLSGVHRNPRTIIQKLPKAHSIEKSDLQRFFAQTQPHMAYLEKTTNMAGFMQSTTNL